MSDNKLELATNAALGEIRRVQAARMTNLHIGLGADMKRSRAWCEYGFPENITNEMLYNVYARGSLAFSAVDKTVKRCWHSYPKIEVADNPSLSELYNKVVNRSVYSAFAEADRRRLAGRFSGLIIRYGEPTKDGKPYSFSDPAGKVATRTLNKLLPAWGTKLTPTAYHSDPERMGQPSMWQYIQDGFGDTQGQALEIHSDRMFILGDYSNGAIGFLEPGYNDLVNLEKITGGTGESFLKNASRQIAYEFDKEIDFAEIARAHGVEVSALKEAIEQHTRSMNMANDAAVVIQGGKANMLVAPIADPEPSHRVTSMNVAASVTMPAKILIGSQSGERASTEDYKEWNETCQSRRTGELTDELTEFVDRLIAHGVLPSARYEFVWDDLTESTTGEKLIHAKTAGEINQLASFSGEPLPFSNKRIAELGGEDVSADDRYL